MDSKSELGWHFQGFGESNGRFDGSFPFASTQGQDDKHGGNGEN
jgi:hypothetical protein